jgi:hypothetical protein
MPVITSIQVVVCHDFDSEIIHKTICRISEANKRRRLMIPHIAHERLASDPLLPTHCILVRPKYRVTGPVVDLIKEFAGVFEHPKELVAIIRCADSRVDYVFFGAAKDGPMHRDARVRELCKSV